jgi:hypothetical protein
MSGCCSIAILLSHAVVLGRRVSRRAHTGPQTLVVLRGEPGHMNFSLADLRTGTLSILGELPANFVTHDFDISVVNSEIVLDRVEENAEVALIERAL